LLPGGLPGDTGGFTQLRLVIKSDEWTRPGGCKPDTLSVTMNGGSLLDPAGSVTVCNARKLQDRSPWRNWATYKKGGSLFDEDGVRVTFVGSPEIRDGDCPEDVSVASLGETLDFVIRLKGSGDRKAPTVVYIGKGSIGVAGCD
jgi:hypothetical protein